MTEPTTIEAEVEAAEHLLPTGAAGGQEVATTEQASQALTIPEGPGALLAATLQLARDPSFDPAKLQIMLDMQYKLEDRQAEREFALALAAAQAEIPQVSRLGIVDLNKKGEKWDPKNRYNFSRLEDIDKVLRPTMEKYGFSIHFDREQREGGGLVVTGTLTHRGGGSRKSSFPLPLDTGAGRNNLQAAGSTDSYARRYILEGFFNIVRKGKDDDGGTAEPLLIDEIEDLIQLLGDTRTNPKAFIKTMSSYIDVDKVDTDDPIALIGQVQRVDFDRMHQALAQKLHNMKKRGKPAEDEGL